MGVTRTPGAGARPGSLSGKVLPHPLHSWAGGRHPLCCRNRHTFVHHLACLTGRGEERRGQRWSPWSQAGDRSGQTWAPSGHTSTPASEDGGGQTWEGLNPSPPRGTHFWETGHCGTGGRGTACFRAVWRLRRLGRHSVLTAPSLRPHSWDDHSNRCPSFLLIGLGWIEGAPRHPSQGP